jgi:hypothetical protein
MHKLTHVSCQMNACILNSSFLSFNSHSDFNSCFLIPAFLTSEFCISAICCACQFIFLFSTHFHRTNDLLGQLYFSFNSSRMRERCVPAVRYFAICNASACQLGVLPVNSIEAQRSRSKTRFDFIGESWTALQTKHNTIYVNHKLKCS